MVSTNPQKIEEALTKGVKRIYPSRGDLEKVLKSGRRIRIYNGIDPTGKLHIGHLVVLKKMKQFQDLGHEIIILIGDFTATIGDPTGKDATRKPLTRKEVLQNSKDYKKQIGKILDLKKANVRFLHNQEWTNKLKPKDMLELASRFTVARLLERDMFQKRIEEGRDIHVHEFLYPIFQAYDSVSMDVDLEIGGNDQIFNMLAGRTLVKKIKDKEKFVLATKLLVDPKGKKIGKTEGNTINLNEKPNEIYGRIMNWPDGLIDTALELCADVPLSKIKKVTNPKNKKSILAKEVISLLYSKELAEKAAKEFDRVFKEKELPFEISEIRLVKREWDILDLLVKAGLASSKSQAKRLIIQKGVKINNKVEDDWQKKIKTEKNMFIQVGKRNFRKII